MSVAYTLEGRTAVVAIDDGKANAFGHDAVKALSQALERAAGEAGAVVVTGRPGRFSAGYDLATMTASDASMQGLVIAGGELLLQAFTLPIPLVVGCTGHALAAGALLLLAADVRIGADGPFKIGLNEVAIGLPLPIYGVELARYRLAPSRFDAVILGDTVDPAGALASGYLDRVVAPEEVVAAARAEADRLSSLDPEAVRRTKLAARAEIAREISATMAADVATLSMPTQLG
jgi:enoyl-CoA hydratase